MDFLAQEINQYVEQHTQAELEVLAKLNRETHAKVMMPRMLSGHLQGEVIRMLSHMIRPQKVLEIGTYTGYSAICWCAGLLNGGKLVTIDINEELETMVRRYFHEAGLADKIDYRIGNALEIIEAIEGPLDIVFIDADKENYSRYYDLVFDKVRSGGYIIADNVLWSGKVIMQEGKVDKDTKAIDAYNKKVHADERVENVLFPIRDGLMVARKK
jgi:caffeoyl-CoA O-methyltransferase